MITNQDPSTKISNVEAHLLSLNEKVNDLDKKVNKSAHLKN